MMKKVLLIVNPVAGKMQSKGELFGIIKVFCYADWDVRVKITREKGEGTKIAREAAENNEVDVITCIGGDGTLNEVMTGLMLSGNKDIRLGYIPAGSTNDFANTLGLSSSLPEVAKGIVESEGYNIDVGKFNDRYFSYSECLPPPHTRFLRRQRTYSATFLMCLKVLKIYRR